MVKGLEVFRDYFVEYTENYVLIGGTACDMAFSLASQEFRVTKDLDIVLIIETMNERFARTFWSFVRDGGYKHRKRGDEGEMQFYRFSEPDNSAFPTQLELFCKRPDLLTSLAEGPLMPIPIGGEGSSLSAILLGEDYYGLIQQERAIREGVSFLKPEALIPLKAAAWLDLTRRKSVAENVDSKDIQKHRRDVFRLFTLLTAETRIVLSPVIQNDLRGFVEAMRATPPDLQALNIRGISVEEILVSLAQIYSL